jgi:AraC-like DNA-binding protein
LNERDTVRVKHEKPRGILHLRAGERLGGLSRYWPSSDLAPFVEHYWLVRWDLPQPRNAETVPHPSIHLVLESSGASEVVGVMRTRFSRPLEGRGRVVGTKFKPGGFRPFIDRAVSTLTGRRPSVTELFGARAASLGADVLAHDDDLSGLAIVESFLRGLRPAADEAMVLAGEVCARIAEDRAISRVDQLVDALGISVRRLQRLFSDYVGVSPKWVIQRYRLLEAVERVPASATPNWAALAADLGYADQAHFIRDFKRLVGRTPADYARGLAPGADRAGR